MVTMHRLNNHDSNRQPHHFDCSIELLLLSYNIQRLTASVVLILTNIVSKAHCSCVIGEIDDGLKCPVFRHLDLKVALTTQIVRFRVRFGH